MITLKSLKIDSRLHKRIKINAANLGIAIGLYAEALMTTALKMNDLVDMEIKRIEAESAKESNARSSDQKE
ncbi:MAG: hypothetical protein H6R04_925 [Burkholderiaceae bacterium]|nr:hypothetical protein [Burkholderiaceae bacterium]